MRNETLEAELNELGLEWEYNEKFALSTIDSGRSRLLQVRDKVVDEETVSRYVVDMRAGAKFPALLLWADTKRSKRFLILDGEQRYHASSKFLQWKTFPAYVVYGTGSPEDATTRDMLAYGANRKHGKALNREERMRHAAHLVEVRQVPPKDAAAITSLPITDVRNGIKLAEGARRAAALGVAPQWEKLGIASRQRMSAISLDKPFKESVILADAAELKTDEINKLCTALAKSHNRSEESALRYIENLAHDKRSTIARRKLSRKTPKSPTAYAAINVAASMIIDQSPEKVAASSPTEQDSRTQVRRIQTVITQLQKITEAHLNRWS